MPSPLQTGPVTDRPARTAIASALGNWRRHAVAALLVAAAFGCAALLASRTATYGAFLVAFAVWMGWFVLTAVDVIREAEF